MALEKATIEVLDGRRAGQRQDHLAAAALGQRGGAGHQVGQRRNLCVRRRRSEQQRAQGSELIWPCDGQGHRIDCEGRIGTFEHRIPKPPCGRRWEMLVRSRGRREICGAVSITCARLAGVKLHFGVYRGPQAVAENV